MLEKYKNSHTIKIYGDDEMKKPLTLILIMILTVSGVGMGFVFRGGEGSKLAVKKGESSLNNEISEEQPAIGTDYVSHPPIRIDNNTDLNHTAQSEGWSGNGSESNPYIIEGYEIDGAGNGSCIYIGNTTEHFVVSDCYLHDAKGKFWDYFDNTALHLYRTANGTVKNNTISSCDYYGVYLKESNDICLRNNLIRRNDELGVYLVGSENNILINNTVESNEYDGISIKEHSDNNTIANNTFVDNSDSLEIISSNRNLIYHNRFMNTNYPVYDNGTNRWNASYPFGGNFWAGYKGYDNYSGPDQKQPGRDGLGDTSYSPPHVSIVDNYPFMYFGTRNVLILGPKDQTENSTGTYTYTLTIKNIGRTNDTYELTKRFDDEYLSVKYPETASVPSGSLVKVEVDVTIPDLPPDISGEHLIFTAVSENNTNVSDTFSFGVYLSRPTDSACMFVPLACTFIATTVYKKGKEKN